MKKKHPSPEVDKWLKVDFENFSELTRAETSLAQQEENEHNELNCKAIMARLGSDKVDELFTTILLVFGPVSKSHHPQAQWFMPGQSFTKFRALLESVSGITFSLTESISWFQEYRRWLEASSRNIRSNTREKPSS